MHPDQFLRAQCAIHISYHSVGLRIAICLCILYIHVNILLFICRGPQGRLADTANCVTVFKYCLNKQINKINKWAAIIQVTIFLRTITTWT